MRLLDRKYRSERNGLDLAALLNVMLEIARGRNIPAQLGAPNARWGRHHRRECSEWFRSETLRLM